MRWNSGKKGGEMKADVFIPSVYKDLNKVSFLVEQLVKHFSDISDIHICLTDKT